MTGGGAPLFTVRPEEPGDAGAIFSLNKSAFPTPDEAALVNDLRRNGRLVVSLVAELDSGQIVGHIAFSPVHAEKDTSAKGVGLAPVAVEPSFQGQGIGGELITCGLDACLAAGWDYCVVLGEPDYYSRFGFLPGSHWGLTDDFGGGDAFQAMELRGGKMPRGGGRVSYAPEFNQFAR